MKKIAVIGAGVAGLAATKRVTESGNNFECITFELSDTIGGTWVYTDNTGKDEYGIPIHSSMYQGLRTNLPKEVMEIPDFPHKDFDNRSYLTSAEVLRYLQDYADHFDLSKYIKFRHYVKRVTPISEERWEIQVSDLKLSKDYTYNFDAVIICIGNYSNPEIPRIPNIQNFAGLLLHSHDYREPSRLANQTVIVIGAGSSALDISCHVCGTAQTVYLSHHEDKVRNIPFPNNLQHKPDVREIRDGKVVFVDGSEVSADAIIFCTGYIFKYSFLDAECAIRVENSIVKPLYKQLINIEHPTMCIVGVARDSPNFDLFDLQVRCFLTIFKGLVTLPSKQDMYAETERDISERVKIVGKEKYYHSIKGRRAKMYFDEIAQFAQLPLVKPVIFDMYISGQENRVKDFRNFRNKVYRVINDREFTVQG